MQDMKETRTKAGLMTTASRIDPQDQKAKKVVLLSQVLKMIIKVLLKFLNKEEKKDYQKKIL